VRDSPSRAPGRDRSWQLFLGRRFGSSMVAHQVREKALGGGSGRSGVPRDERFVNEKTTPQYLRTEVSVKTKTLLVCGVIAGPLFVVAFLVEGATRTHYDPLRHPVSSLAFGDSGWTQRASFLITGLLMLAFAIGLQRALRPLRGPIWRPLLVGASAVGLLGAGIFVADPMNGYPPGTPDKRLDYSTHGVLHDLFSTPFFLGLPVTCFLFSRWFAARGKRGWATYSAVTGVVLVSAFILSSAGFGQTEGLVDVAGLFQRVTLIVGFGWLTLLAVHFLRSPP
jgi:hypothetical membrane protein